MLCGILALALMGAVLGLRIMDVVMDRSTTDNASDIRQAAEGRWVDTPALHLCRLYQTTSTL